MKRYAILFLLFLGGIIIQQLWMNIFRTPSPDIVLLLLVFSSLKVNKLIGSILGFSFGLMYDVVLTDTFCLSAISYSIIGYIIGSLSGKIDETSNISQVSIMLIALFLNYLIKYPLSMLFLNSGLLLTPFLISSFYTLIFTIPFYRLMDKLWI